MRIQVLVLVRTSCRDAAYEYSTRTHAGKLFAICNALQFDNLGQMSDKTKRFAKDDKFCQPGGPLDTSGRYYYKVWESRNVLNTKCGGRYSYLNPSIRSTPSRIRAASKQASKERQAGVSMLLVLVALRFSKAKGRNEARYKIDYRKTTETPFEPCQ